MFITQKPEATTPKNKIEVLVVDDSAVARQVLGYILNSDPGIQVIGTAQNGEEALKAIARRKPQVITMDINMPGMDGFEVTRRIMETTPVPIVIVSNALNPAEARSGILSMEAGALAVLSRPPGPDSPLFAEASKNLVDTIKLMAGVRVMRRARRPATPTIPIRPANAQGQKRIPGQCRLVVIGASTGGPVALRDLLQNLPKPFPWPIAIVQHITPGFCPEFVRWLGESSRFPVCMAEQGQILAPGQAYVAPDGFHMEVTENLAIRLCEDPPEQGLKPAVSRLFTSACASFGSRVTAVLLTGMGRDGAAELLAIKQAGGLTFAQDADSSVVHGMPGEAIKLGAAIHILSPDEIALQLHQQMTD